MSNKRKKVGLFIGSDITAHLILNKIVPEMRDSNFTPVIFLPKHKSNDNAALPQLKDMAFFERHLLSEVVYPYLNGRTDRPKPVAPIILAKRHNLKCIEVEDINDPDFVNRQKRARDYVGALSVRCFQIFQPSHIDVWRNKGFLLNLHPGVLPQYQGVMSVARAMADKTQENYGLTLHHIDRGIDTGNILTKQVTPIDRTKSVLEATIDLADSGALSITRAFEDLNSGRILEGTEQPPRGAGANYYTYPTSEELREWEKSGLRLVDPEKIACLYTNIFSDPQTEHGRKLKERLRAAIENREVPLQSEDNTPRTHVRQKTELPKRTFAL